jgi:hypothetical protein
MASRDQAPRDDRTFIVGFWAAIFRVLRQISILHALRVVTSISPRLARIRVAVGSPWFVEVWALAHLVLAAAAIVIATASPTSTLAIVLAYYGIFRTFEIVVLQLNIMLFDEYHTRRTGGAYSLRGYRRSVVLLLQNFAEIVLWFAAAYAIFSGPQLVPHDPSVGGLIRESFLTTVTFGSSSPQVIGSEGLALVAWQGLVGLLVTLLSLARFVGLLPRPESRDQDDVEA